MRRADEKARALASYITGAILMVPAITSFCSSAFGVAANYSLIAIAAVLMLLLVWFFLLRPKLFVSRMAIIACVVMIAVFVVTKAYFPDTKYTIFQLCFYVFLPLFISQQSLNYEKVLRIIVVMSIPLVFSIEKTLVLENVGLNQADMYATYSFVPPIVAAFTHFLFYRRELKGRPKSIIIVAIGYVLNMFYCVRVAKTAVRGYWIVLVVFALLLVLIFMQKRMKRKMYRFLLVAMFLAMLCVVLNFDKIINALVDSDNGITSGNTGVLLKMRKLASAGDLLNGRGDIWQDSMGYIVESPVFGHGIESMYRLSGGMYVYPHNFILQLLQDCGISMLLFIYSVCYMVYDFLRYGYRRDKAFSLFLIAITIPIMLLSDDVWKSVSLWIMIGYSFRLMKERKSEQD